MERKRLTNSQVNTFGLYGFTTMIGIIVPMMYIAVFMTEYLKMSAVLMGTILLVARTCDFFIGLSAGGVIEKARFKGGKYRSWFAILRWAVLIGVFMQFANTSALPLAARVVIVFIGYLGLHGSMDYLAPAQFGVVAMMAGPSAEDRNRLAFRNAQFSAIGSIVISAIGLPAVNLLTPIVGGSTAFTIVATAGAAIFFLGATLVTNVSKPYDLPVPKGAAAANLPKITLGDMVRSVYTNSQLLFLLLGQIFFNIAGQVSMAIMAYYFLFVLGNMTLMALALTITGIAAFAGSLIGPKIGSKLGRRRALYIGMLMTSLFSLGIAFFGAASMTVYIIFACLNSIANYIFWSFGQLYFLDAGEYGYWKTGKDNRAVSLAMGNMPIKIGMALGGTLGAYGLAFIGYTPNMIPTAEFTSKFMYLFGGLPAVLCLIGGLIIMLGYKLKDEDIDKYAAENALKTAADQAKALA